MENIQLTHSNGDPVKKGDELTANGHTMFVSGWNSKDIFVVPYIGYPHLHAQGFAHSAYGLTLQR